jgi:hypothetical protein
MMAVATATQKFNHTKIFLNQLNLLWSERGGSFVLSKIVDTEY